MKKRLTCFLEKYKILSNNQYGFRKKVSTQNAVTDLITEILHEIDKGKKPILVLLDIEKAFDTITHGKLLKKMESIGVKGIALKWFSSYLRERKQLVEIECFFSDVITCNNGLL